MDPEVIGAHDVGRGLRAPRDHRRRLLQVAERMRVQATERPANGVGIALVVEALRRDPWVEPNGVVRSHDEPLRQVGSSLPVDTGSRRFLDRGFRTGLSGIEGQGGDEDQALDRWVVAGLGDHGPAIGVTDEDSRFIQAVEHLGDAGGISVEVGERSRVRPAPREVDGHGAEAQLRHARHDLLPAPGAVPSAVDEDDVANHGAHYGAGSPRGAPADRLDWSPSRQAPVRLSSMPETTGLGRVLLIGALAVVFGLGATSLLAAILGDRWGGPAHTRRRGVALVVGFGYLALGLLVLLAFHDQIAG